MVVWSSLNLPSKIRKGSGDPCICIIDLCHKQKSGSCSRFLNVVLTPLFVMKLQFMHAVHESGGKRRMAGVAEKRVALAVKEDTWKLGYQDVKACQLEFIAGLVSR